MKRVLAMPCATSFGMALAGTAYAQTAQVTPKAPPGGAMESESTTKRTGPGPNTKRRTDDRGRGRQKYETARRSS